METLEPLPSIARGLGPAADPPDRCPGAPSPSASSGRASTGSSELPPPGRVEAADRRPSPPASSDRRPAGPAPLAASYRFDASANSIVVVLIRPETDQVVRQIPPEKILQLMADLRDVVTRALDERA